MKSFNRHCIMVYKRSRTVTFGILVIKQQCLTLHLAQRTIVGIKTIRSSAAAKCIAQWLK